MKVEQNEKERKIAPENRKTITTNKVAPRRAEGIGSCNNLVLTHKFHHFFVAYKHVEITT